MLHYLRSSPTSTSVPAMHRSACSLLATFTTLVLPSPPQSFANMLLLKKWTWVCFLKSLPSLTQIKHLAISMYGPFTVSSAGRCGTVTPLIFTVNILCLLAFLILTSWWWETFLCPAIPYLSGALSSLQISASSPWMYKVFLYQTIHKSYILSVFLLPVFTLVLYQ